MNLIITKYGGCYLCQEYTKTKDWIIATNATMISKRKKNNARYGQCSIKRNSITIIDNIECGPEINHEELYELIKNQISDTIKRRLKK